MTALYYSIVHLTYKLLQSLVPLDPPSEEEEGAVERQDRVFRAELAIAMYLGRNNRVNPTVFLDWGQEIAMRLLVTNFSSYGSLEINESKTIFMRNIRLLFSRKIYDIEWVAQPYKLSVEAFNSNTGKTSFDLTLRWFYEGSLIATLIRKMVYVSAKTGKPIPLPDGFIAGNPDHNPIKFSLIKDVPTSASKFTLTVRPSDIDFNNHVGHPVYVDYILDSAFHSTYQLVSSDLLSENIRCIDIEYRFPIVLDRGVSVRSWDQIEEGPEGGFQVNFVMYQRAAASSPGKQSSDIVSDITDREPIDRVCLDVQSSGGNDKSSSDNLSSNKHSDAQLSSDKQSDVKQIVCLAKVLLFDK